MGQEASEERARPRPNPFSEGRATGQLLTGSRVITVSMWRGSSRGRARNKRDPGLTRNRFKTNKLWKKVRFWTLLYAIRIIDCYVLFVAAAILFSTMEWRCSKDSFLGVHLKWCARESLKRVMLLAILMNRWIFIHVATKVVQTRLFKNPNSVRLR